MELWDRFEGSSADEMDIKLSGDHFRLKKNPKVVAVPQGAVVTAAAAESAPAADNPSDTAEETDQKVIRSPLAGTFYRSSSPGEEPFISVGAQVHQGDVIGVVEAMKLFNEVKATEDGTVRVIMAEDGELVEYNQVLVVLD